MRSIFSLGWGLVALSGTAGCANLLGLEEWQDPVAEPQESEEDAGPTGNGTCVDRLQNGTESGVDCGGDICPKCASDNGCNVDGDCASGYCPAERGFCTIDDGRAICGSPDPQNPSCADCVQNSDETDVDCGGVCTPCRPGKKCSNAADCWSGVCEGAPMAMTCSLGAKGVPCYSNDDCQSGSCGNQGCALAGACCH